MCIYMYCLVCKANTIIHKCSYEIERIAHELNIYLGIQQTDESKQKNQDEIIKRSN